MATLQEWKRHPLFGEVVPEGEDEILGHYTSAASAAAIALTGLLLPSPLSALNDPSESQQQGAVTIGATFRSVEGIIWDDPAPSVQDADAANAALRDGVRVQCFTLDRGQGLAWGAAQNDLRTFARQRMWAQYGAGHEGICLLLNRSRLEAQVKHAFGDQGRCGEVAYIEGFDNSHGTRTGSFHRNTEINFLDSTLFRKNADWRAEAEFRVRVHSWDEGVCKLPLDNCVVGMVLGMRFPQHLLPIAESIATRFDIVNSSAKAMMSDGRVIDTNPAHKDGVWRSWTDAEIREIGTVYDLR